MFSTIVKETNINLLLTERGSDSGEYWTEPGEVSTKTTEGLYSPVRLGQVWLVSVLSYGNWAVLGLSLPTFENRQKNTWPTPVMGRDCDWLVVRYSWLCSVLWFLSFSLSTLDISSFPHLSTHPLVFFACWFYCQKMLCFLVRPSGCPECATITGRCYRCNRSGHWAKDCGVVFPSNSNRNGFSYSGGTTSVRLGRESFAVEYKVIVALACAQLYSVV